MTVALSGWWYVGWGIGAAVVVVAALLLLVIIAIGRRVAAQAGEITKALDGTRANTTALWDVTRTNLALDRITRYLRVVRTGGGE